jgi:hypothetical protein
VTSVLTAVAFRAVPPGSRSDHPERSQYDDRELIGLVVSFVVGAGRQPTGFMEGRIRQSPGRSMAWAAVNGTQVALPEYQLVVPVISKTAWSARRRSSSAWSELPKAAR